MKKLLIGLFTCTILFNVSPVVDAHSGRTDSNGGHNCSAKSIQKGLCTGYHYHNSGSSSSGAGSSRSTSTVTTPTVAKPALVTADVYIDGAKQEFNQKAYIKDGTTLVPMRPIFEALGADVHYDSSSKKVTGTKNGKHIVLSVGNKKGYINENGVTNSVDLSYPAEITNDSTMVPLRFIGESLGANVQWDSASQSVKITN